MENIKIDGYIFTSNSAFDGYAIYIEGDDLGTAFIINKSIFTDDYDGKTNSIYKPIITSEIKNLYEGKVIEFNIFKFSNSANKALPLLYVDHYVNPPIPSETSTEPPN